MSNQLSLSFELICFMDWIIKNGKEKFRLLVKEAVNNDIANNLDSLFQEDSIKISNNLYNTVLDFVIFLEDILGEELDKVDEEIIPKDKIDDLVIHLDNKILDPRTVWLSIHQARKNLSKKQPAFAKAAAGKGNEAKKEIFDKILKNWEPIEGDIN